MSKKKLYLKKMINVIYIMYATEEERMKALRASRNKSQKRPWFCDICGKNYTMGGKTMHLKTLKHQKR